MKKKELKEVLHQNWHEAVTPCIGKFCEINFSDEQVNEFLDEEYQRAIKGRFSLEWNLKRIQLCREQNFAYPHYALGIRN